MVLSLKNSKWLIIGLILFVGIYIYLYSILKYGFWEPNAYDSYTLQAQAWQQGHIFLDKDYPWLELAIYQNHYFVSFPPFPSIVSLLLLSFFKNFIPTNALVTFYTFCSFIVVYLFSRIKKNTDFQSFLWATYVVLGCNLVSLSVFGAVWFNAQVLNFFLLVSSMYLLSLKTPLAWYAGIASFALAIGCRPLEIIFLPVFLLLLYSHHKEQYPILFSRRSVARFLSYLIVPAIIFGSFGLYNYARFGNPLEPGHNYLPEHNRDALGQFNVAFIKTNFEKIWRLPNYHSPLAIDIPTSEGFAFYLTNPLFITLCIRLLRQRTKPSLLEIFLVLGIVGYVFILLMHRTMGAWQFGMRYFIDVVPFVFLFALVRDKKLRWYDYPLILYGVFVNIAGTIWMYSVM